MRTPEEWFEIERKASEHLELIVEVARLKEERDFMRAQYVAAEAEVLRLRWQVEQAEIDIKELGFEAHPAVLMRMDRLVRSLHGEGEK